MSKGGKVDQFHKEKPVHSRPRRLVDWINPTGAKKVHSLIDKVYQRKNLEMAWETVEANRGSGGVDGQSLDGFAAQLDQQVDRLQSELKDDQENGDDPPPALHSTMVPLHFLWQVSRPLD